MFSWRARIQTWLAPLALLVVAMLSYGLWIPWLGLYGNDLPYLYYFHLLGPWGPGLFAEMDRPISSLFYAASMSVLGEQPWLYHIYLLVLRWLSGILLWWVLRLVWPDRKRESTLAALLFVVYPGFRQNPVALEFILHIAVLDLFLLSLGTMLLTVINPRRRIIWLVISTISAGGVFFLEYFIGLEILRPIFLWIKTHREGWKGRKQWIYILKVWSPSLLVVSAFLFWRIFIFKLETYRPVLFDALSSAPLQGMTQLALTILRDLRTSMIGAWNLVIQFPLAPRLLVATIFLVVLTALIVFFVLRWLDRQQESIQPISTRGTGHWGEMALCIGLITMLVSGLVFWVTGIQVSTEFPWDRSTLSFMLGASLVGAGLLEMMIMYRYRLLVAAVVVSLAVGSHYQNAVVYRQEWAKLQSFFWQLTWRVPDLQPGTLILFDVIPLNRYSDSDLTTILNWTYAPDLKSRRIHYKFFDLTIRLNSQHAGLPGLDKDLPVEHNHRGLLFSTTTSHMLAVHYNPPGCLLVLGPEDASLPDLPDRLVKALPLVNMEQIIPEADQTRPPWQLGAEPAHDWCYFYQKASLAIQRQDWQTVAEWGDEAFNIGLHWNEPVELLPFIEGYAISGNLIKAKELTSQAKSESGLQSSLCRIWEGIRMQQDTQLQNAAADILADLTCVP